MLSKSKFKAWFYLKNYCRVTQRYVDVSDVARQFIVKMPPSLGKRVSKEWLRRANSGQCRECDKGGDGDPRPDAANLWINQIAKPLLQWDFKLPLDADDGDIRSQAESLAQKYIVEGNQLDYQAQLVERVGEAVNADSLEIAIEKQAVYDLGVMRLAKLAKADGVDIDRFMSAKYQSRAVVKRLCDEAFVARQLRRGFGRERENLIRNHFNAVSRRAGLYVSDEGFGTWKKQKARNRALLEAMTVLNELGESFDLMEIVEKSEANPRLRNVGLMVRIAGFEKIERDLGHVGEFITITCPSRFHAVYEQSGALNPKFDGSSPRDAAAYLQRVWARIRSALASEGIQFYGFRVAEPHHDGCPHWHGLFFMAAKSRMRFRQIVAMHACRDSADELGLDYMPSEKAKLVKAREIQYREKIMAMQKGNTEYRTLKTIMQFMPSEKEFWQNAKSWHFKKVNARVDFEVIDWGKGSAAGYIAKYIAKNIDGRNAYGESVGMDSETEGEDVTKTVERVLAWASLWGIRQFQQVGGPPVGVWRELRRLDLANMDASDDLTLAAHAADAGDWGKFVMLMGGVDCKRADRPVQLYKEEQKMPNRYGETRDDAVRGVIEMATGQFKITRIHEWTIVFQKNGGNAAAWTCVNNCRKNNSTFEMLSGKTNNSKEMLSKKQLEEIGATEYLMANGRMRDVFRGIDERILTEYRYWLDECARHEAQQSMITDEQIAEMVEKARMVAKVKDAELEEKRQYRDYLRELRRLHGKMSQGILPKLLKLEDLSGKKPNNFLRLSNVKTVDDVLWGGNQLLIDIEKQMKKLANWQYQTDFLN